MKKNNSAIGSNWNDVRKKLFTPEEIAESDLRVSIISEIINARNEKGISQKQLELMSGKTTCYCKIGKRSNQSTVRHYSKTISSFR